MSLYSQRPVRTLFDPSAERDACGVGFIATIAHESDKVLDLALGSLCRLSHRGAVGFDKGTGDGAGVITQIPTQLFARELKKTASSSRQTKSLSEPIGVGVFFLPPDPKENLRSRTLAEDGFKENGIPFHGWREVPTNPKVIGEWARKTAPDIVHALVTRPQGDDSLGFERRLFLCRRWIERAALEQSVDGLYVASLSSRTIVYKGLLMADQLGNYYLDLQDSEYQTLLAVYHQRYSTNTMPTWRRGGLPRTRAQGDGCSGCRGLGWDHRT